VNFEMPPNAWWTMTTRHRRPFFPPAAEGSGGFAHDLVQPPAMGDVPKFVLASVVEDEAGAGHEVLMMLVARTCQGSAIAASLAPTCTVMARTESPSSLLNRAHMAFVLGRQAT